MRKFTFNPVASPNGSTLQTQIPGGAPLRVVLANYSPANLTLNFANGYSAALISQDRRRFEIQNINNGNIGWTIDSYMGSIFPGLSLVVVEVYEPGEAIVEQYPSPVPPVAAPNLQLFTQAVAQTNNNNLKVPKVTGKLFYLTRFEVFSGYAVSSTDLLEVDISQGGFLNAAPGTITYFFPIGTAVAVNEVYEFPSPYVQASAGTSLTGNIPGGANVPATTLNLWGYYI